jgi:antitoxin HicB
MALSRAGTDLQSMNSDGLTQPSAGERRLSVADRPEATVEEYLARPYHLLVVRDGEDKGKPWTASVEELAGCTSRGKTADAALEGLRSAMTEWLGVALEEGREIPEPKSATSHSGRLLLRMPRTLHAELTRASEREGVSLNQFITDVLAAAVVWRSRAETNSKGRAAGPIQTPGAQSLTTELDAAHTGAKKPSRLMDIAMTLNFVVVAIVGIVAIVVLFTAWR